MALSTYAELQESVAGWLARDDLTARIPDFITLAEAKFNRELRCIQMERRSTATVDLASDEPEFITLPSNFQTMRRIRLSSVTGKPRLEFLSGAQADEFRYGTSNTEGQPRYFTIFGDEIELLPTPDIAYTVEMTYRSYLTALSDVATTNWLLTLAPDAYLYGALMESAPYMKEDARINTWSAGLGFAMDGLNKLSMDQAYGSGPLVMRITGNAQ
jgi:hypothetical protein